MEINKSYFQINETTKKEHETIIKSDFIIVSSKNRNPKHETVWNFRTKFGVIGDETVKVPIYDNNRKIAQNNQSDNSYGFVWQNCLFPPYDSNDDSGNINGYVSRKNVCSEYGCLIKKKFQEVIEIYIDRIDVPQALLSSLPFFNHTLYLSIDELSGFGQLHTETSNNISFNMILTDVTPSSYIYSSTVPITFNKPTNISALSFKLSNSIDELPNQDSLNFDTITIDDGNLKISFEDNTHLSLYKIGQKICFGEVNLFQNSDNIESNTANVDTPLQNSINIVSNKVNIDTLQSFSENKMDLIDISSEKKSFLDRRLDNFVNIELNDKTMKKTTILLRSLDGELVKSYSVTDNLIINDVYVPDNKFIISNAGNVQKHYLVLTDKSKNLYFDELDNIMPRYYALITNNEIIKNHIIISGFSTIIAHYFISKGIDYSNIFKYMYTNYEIDLHHFEKTNRYQQVLFIIFILNRYVLSCMRYSKKLTETIKNLVFLEITNFFFEIIKFDKNKINPDNLEELFQRIFLNIKCLEQKTNLINTKKLHILTINFPIFIKYLLDIFELKQIQNVIDEKILFYFIDDFLNKGLILNKEISNVLYLMKQNYLSQEYEIVKTMSIIDNFSLKNVDIFNLKIDIISKENQGILKENIKHVQQILDDLILAYYFTFIDRNFLSTIFIEQIKLENSLVIGKILFSERKIQINENIYEDYSENIYLNRQRCHILVPILLHMILQLLGVREETISNLQNKNNNVVKNYYEILKRKDFNITNPEIDSFTILNCVSKDETPIFPEEIITNFFTLNNDISIITLGFLEDLGYIVNYKSKFINNLVDHHLIIDDKCIPYEKHNPIKLSKYDEELKLGFYKSYFIHSNLDDRTVTDKMRYIEVKTIKLNLSDDKLIFDVQYYNNFEGIYVFEYFVCFNNILTKTNIVETDVLDTSKIRYILLELEEKIEDFDDKIIVEIHIKFYHKSFIRKFGEKKIIFELSPDTTTKYMYQIYTFLDYSEYNDTNLFDGHNDVKIHQLGISETENPNRSENDTISNDINFPVDMFHHDKVYTIADINLSENFLTLNHNFGNQFNGIKLISNENSSNFIINLHLQIYLTLLFKSKILNFENYKEIEM